MRFHRPVVALLVLMSTGGLAATARAVTPGWECVPTTAGQAVTSGGTGASPSCASGTPVLAPTYVSSGVGGKPTVQFSSVNVQIVSGSGSTSGTPNGTGNLVIGYDESPGSQTGSHNLVLGTGQTYTSYGSIVGGSNNSAKDQYTSVMGQYNAATGPAASVAGGRFNTASGFNASVVGGYANNAVALYSAISGGCSNRAGSGTNSVNSNCTATMSITFSGANTIDLILVLVDGGAKALAIDIDDDAITGWLQE